jgi:hypothetical protein
VRVFLRPETDPIPGLSFWTGCANPPLRTHTETPYLVFRFRHSCRVWGISGSRIAERWTAHQIVPFARDGRCLTGKRRST